MTCGVGRRPVLNVMIVDSVSTRKKYLNVIYTKVFSFLCSTQQNAALSLSQLHKQCFKLCRKQGTKCPENMFSLTTGRNVNDLSYNG